MAQNVKNIETKTVEDIDNKYREVDENGQVVKKQHYGMQVVKEAVRPTKEKVIILGLMVGCGIAGYFIGKHFGVIGSNGVGSDALDDIEVDSVDVTSSTVNF